MEIFSEETIEIKIEEKTHSHIDANGNVYSHIHNSGSESDIKHRHSHSHDEEHKKKVCNRLSKVIGHLESIKRMVQDDRDCSEVLIQLMAVKSALSSTEKYILKEHLSHCIVDAVKENDYDTINELNKIIDYFI